jgi:hypothetical protein
MTEQDAKQQAQAISTSKPAVASHSRDNPLWRTLYDRGADAAQRATLLERYGSGEQSFVSGLLPEQAVQLSAAETLDTLRARYGEVVDSALDQAVEPPTAELPAELRSPVARESDTRWLRHANIIGINVRTIDSYWNIVKYALTLPRAYNAIHVLPIWEPGVVKSLYGITSWEINREFYSEELAQVAPQLDTPARQLRAVVHLLHVMGKAVGMEVIPHTDRFSEIALAFPSYFEWIRRDDDRIADHSAELHRKVEEQVIAFLQQAGPAVELPESGRLIERLFDESAPVSEEQRLLLLFGEPQDFERRERRRVALVRHLHAHGYEPLPATMGPPYRGICVDQREEAITIDAQGLSWRDFTFERPESMSRVFNPLARFKLYERLNDNAQWEIDFDSPRPQVWRYVCEKYARVQREFGFDFMRGDMSHVQMRAGGVPAEPGAYYDILTAVKQHIRQEQSAPYFGYFAEGFLAPRGVMAYGDEVDHLEASDADVTLGDLQSIALDDPDYWQQFRRYLDITKTRRFAAAFTTITSDKDDPRFDKFYLTGNALRAFVALFLSDTSSYTSLGGEIRDIHHEPAPNEHYTKLFVFHETSGPKATSGPYVWGHNAELFNQIDQIRRYADAAWPEIEGRTLQWLIYPDPTARSKLFAWAQEPAGERKDCALFVVNGDTRRPLHGIHIPIPGSWGHTPPDIRCELAVAELGQTPGSTGDTVPPGPISYYLEQLAPGECRVYRALQRSGS